MAGPGVIVTAETIRDYMDEVNRLVDAIHAAVTADLTKIPPQILAAWARFISDWKVFFGTNRPECGIIGCGILGVWGSVADTTERYEKDALRWRETMGRFSSMQAVVYDPNKKPGGLSLDGLPSLETAAVIAVAIAAIAVFRR